MAYEFTRKTDNIDDVMAADVNELQAAIEAHKFLTLKAATELTIASGAITAVQAVHKLQPESGTTDDLVTINGMDAGDILILYVSDEGTDTITIKHGTGNISCVGGDDIALSEGAVICYFDGTTVFVSGGGGVVFSAIRVYTSNDTWSKPAGLHSIVVEVIGGGGGGGGVTSASSQYAAGGGGGGGGYSKKRVLAASLGATETVTVGVGGNGGEAGANNGSAGGTSSFGAHCSATGGGGGLGQAASATQPRAGGFSENGGVGSGGDINSNGSGAPRGMCLAGGTLSGGGGAAGLYSGNRIQNNALNNSSAGLSGVAYGGGGQGASSNNDTTNRGGGNGAAGVVVVYEFTET